MDENNLSTKDKIMLAALEVIGEQGTEHVTTRVIAKRANVNHAAINYYFESKEDLLEKALQYFQSGLLKIFQMLEDRDSPANERLMRFSKEFIRYNSRYPGVEHHVLSRLMTRDETNTGICELMKKNLSSIEAVLNEMLTPIEEKELRFKALSFFSGLIYPLLLSRYGSVVMDAEYGDNETTHDYITSLVGSIANRPM